MDRQSRGWGLEYPSFILSFNPKISPVTEEIMPLWKRNMFSSFTSHKVLVKESAKIFIKVFKNFVSGLVSLEYYYLICNSKIPPSAKNAKVDK